MKQVKYAAQIIIGWVMVCCSTGFAQQTQGWLLEKMPSDLETDYALSALPPRLRDGATVYLLDPKKGYYMTRQGTNGYATFVDRYQWECAEFIPDAYAPISYDAEGAKTYLPIHFAAMEMRATGKYTPAQIKDTIMKRIKDGTYKAPSRTGVSYMLAPIFRGRVDEQGIINTVMPHFMFYAPGVDNTDIGGVWDGHTPYAINSGRISEKEYSILNFIILPAGEAEKAKILDDDKNLIARLAAYKSFLKVDIMQSTAEHHH
jgi:hypothetical protein